MFGEDLLDSSRARAPVLERIHYLLSAVAGTLALLVAFYLLPPVSVPLESKLRALEACFLGAAALGYALMLCYVYADAQHLGLRGACWLVVALLFNIGGFITYLVFSAARTGNWKRATIPAAYLLQVVLLGMLVLVPLVHVEALPKVLLFGPLVSAPASPPPPPAAGRASQRSPRRATLEEILKAPVSIPRTIALLHEEPLPAEGAAGQMPGVPGGISNGVPHGIWGAVVITPWSSPPPPPLQPKGAHPQRIRVGGQVIAARLIYQPKPEYPPLAKMARIQGTVLLEAIIGRDGTIRELKVLSGHPLLAKAALEAVQRWRYQPTLLNGEPVEVLTEISVSFALAE